ncbi:MAG: hypothetical protein FGM54_02625 [Chitinophagaceae bacterium]|nr:hypothetical protein [Chitinophagaceae bacterium]
MAQTHFVILTQGRTGSNLLCSLLNTNPAIYADGEIFNKKEQLKKHPSWWVNGIRHFPHWYIKHRASKTHKLAYGFKLLVEQWPQPIETGVQALIDRQFLPIYLFRKNTISQLISTVIANQQNRWVVNSEQEYHEAPIALNFDLAMFKMKQIEERTHTLNTLCQQYPGLNLYYEEHLLNNRMFDFMGNEVCFYLNVPKAPMQTKMLKTDIRSDRERISNLDEFLAFMADAGYEQAVDYYLKN